MGVKIDNVTKTFGDVLAVKDVSFEVETEEIVVLLGPSGCGKTTTLRCVAGLEKPDNGRVVISGEDVTEMKPKDRNSAFVFQDIALFPHMSVERNMRFGLDVQGIGSKEERQERVNKIAELLQIDKLLKRNPDQLSGGQKQRVAVGRALVLDPDVFLLDEPFANLDANLKIELRTETKKLQRNLSIPTIFVTHDQEEAMVLADTIALLRSGEIQQIGSPDDLYDDPQNVFTTRFIGSPEVNLFHGEITREGDSFNFSHSDLSLPLELTESGEDLPVGSEVSLAIRPENVSVNVPEEEELLETRFTLIEPLGSRRVIYLETSSGKEIRALLTSDADGFKRGEELNVSFDLQHAWFFDETGERVGMNVKRI